MSSIDKIAVAGTDPADNPVVKAALVYAAQGLPVFPVRPDKRPYTLHGFKDASTDPARITRWWTDWPAALIGMPTGKPTDLHVIDVDVHSHDGFQTLKKLDFNREGVPCVATPSGGNHFYHRLGGRTLKGSAGKLGPGVDTRGDGGYIIVPPSRPDRPSRVTSSSARPGSVGRANHPAASRRQAQGHKQADRPGRAEARVRAGGRREPGQPQYNSQQGRV